MSPGSAVPVARPARWAAFLHDHVVFGSRTEPKSSRSRRILLTVRCFCAPQNRQRPRLRPPVRRCPELGERSGPTFAWRVRI